MSGGVDSSVAAYLLKEEGYEVTGLSLAMKAGDDFSCAENICGILGINHAVFDCSADFDRYVVRYYADEYRRGRTPNPCVECNRHIKWRFLNDYAGKTGAERIATGHYAEVGRYAPTGRLAVRNTGSAKDQSYVLYTLSQDILGKILFPLQKAGYDKQKVRETARQIGLPNADARDSQDVCFAENVETAKGAFIDENGKALGEHNGISNYTVGQRKGLGIALGEPMFIKKINPLTNEITLSADERLYSREIVVSDVCWMGQEKPDGNGRNGTAGEYLCKIRYAHKPAACRVEIDGDGLRATFDEPVRAVTPGQSAVFYRDGFIMFGGVID